jgi:diguanylate cyclase (GGDEF)-like protein
MKKKIPGKITGNDALHDIDSHIMFSLDYEAYLHSIINFLMAQSSAATAFIAFYDATSRKVSQLVARGVELPRKNLACFESLSLKAITTGGPVRIAPLNGDVSAIAITPLFLKDEPVAAAGIVNPARKKNFSAAELKLFTSTAKKLSKDIFYIKVQLDYREQLSRLRVLYNISQAVRETLDLNKLLQSIMEIAKNILNAEASSLAIIDNKTNELIFTVAEGEKGRIIKEIRLKMGQGVIGWAAQKGKPLLITDVKKDKRFYKGADDKSGFVTKSILCVPLMVRNNIIGAVEVLNKKDGSSFGPEDIDLLSTLAGEAAVALENARLFSLATTDGLTGANTIRYFRTLYDHEFSRSVRYKRNLSLILSDIDHFKNVNDTYGHQIGDLILKETAGILKNSVRDIDVVGRYGGEEFIVMLPETQKENALVLADRLRKKVEEHVAVDQHGKEYKVTISMGVASFTGKETMEELIKLADTALYKAKETGRNRVCTA